MRIHSGLTRGGTHAHARLRVTRGDTTRLGAAATVARHWGTAFVDAVRRLPGRIARSLRDLRDGLRGWRVLVGVAVRSVRYGLYDPMTPTDLTPDARDIARDALLMEPVDPLDPHVGHVVRLARRANGGRIGRASRGLVTEMRDVPDLDIARAAHGTADHRPSGTRRQR